MCIRDRNTVDNVTTTSVRELDDIERHEEIARMLAGEKITDEARAAARVLIGAWCDAGIQKSLHKHRILSFYKRICAIFILISEFL